MVKKSCVITHDFRWKTLVLAKKKNCKKFTIGKIFFLNRSFNWYNSKTSNYYFFNEFSIFWIWKIIKNKHVDIFAFCQLKKFLKIMICMWKTFGAKIRTYDFGPKIVRYTLTILGEKLWLRPKKKSQTFTIGNTYFEQMFHLIELEKFELFSFY